jgi:hypothetical protein
VTDDRVDQLAEKLRDVTVALVTADGALAEHLARFERVGDNMFDSDFFRGSEPARLWFGLPETPKRPAAAVEPAKLSLRARLKGYFQL